MIALAALVLTGCTRGVGAQTEAELAGRISLSWDATTEQGRMVVASYLPATATLPAERHGVPMETCVTLVPRSLLDGALRDAEVSASCEGEEIPLEPRAAGLWAHRFPSPLAAGTRCEVELDGRTYELPALPEAPDLVVRGRRLRWTASDGDEVRVVIPRMENYSTLCRFHDDGAATAPRPGLLAFTTRHRYGLPAAERGRIAISVTAGAWWERAVASQ